jgi:hypothetical protein
LILLIGYGAYLAWLFGTSDGMLDSSGQTLGAGFARVWSAGRLVSEGRSEAAFDPALHQLYLRDLFGTESDFSHGWRSSPAFLLVAGMLAAFPYLTALVGFVLITLSLYLAAIERICEKTGIGLSTLYLVAAADPAALACVSHGDDGLLRAALIGGGLAVFSTRPLLGGFLIGLLAYSPHPGLLMIPIALMAAGAWRTLAAATATIAIIAIISVSFFGVTSWLAFFALAPSVRGVSIDGVLVFCAMSLLSVGLWRSFASPAQKSAGLIFLLALTTTPDGAALVLIGPGIAFLVADGIARGFAPFERSLLALFWIAPLFVVPLSPLIYMPVGPLLSVGAFAMIWHKIYRASQSTNCSLMPAQFSR